MSFQATKLEDHTCSENPNQSKTILAREKPEQREMRLVKVYQLPACSKQNETPKQIKTQVAESQQMETPDLIALKVARKKIYNRKYQQKETPEQKEKRLAKLRERSKRRLQKETPEQKEKRWARDREAKARRLRTETPEQRNARLAKIREGVIRRREKETPEQRAERIARKAISQQKYEQSLTPEQKERRLAAIHERYIRRRQKTKTHNSLSQCLTDEDHSNSQISIKTESEEFEQEETQLTDTTMSSDVWVVPEQFKIEETKRKEGQFTKEHPYQTKTEIETPVLDQKIILCKSQSAVQIKVVNEKFEAEKKCYNHKNQQNETPEAGEKRLAASRACERCKHKMETPEQSARRRARVRERKQKETPEEREKRLTAQRTRERRRRQKETPEQREKRLARDREAKARRKRNETPEERKQRIAKIRETEARRRQKRKTAEETPERRTHKSLSQCLTIKTENEVFEQEETQLTDSTMSSDAWVVPGQLKTEETKQKEGQFIREHPYQSSTEIGETLTLDQKPSLCKSQSAFNRIKSKQMENKTLIQSELASSSLAAARDIKQDPPNLPIILINDEKKTIIVDMKNVNL